MDERMTDWSTLTDACGSAEHVTALLDRFEADPSGVWSELMDHLCPQLDTAFAASFAALPRLAEIATAGSPETLGEVLLAAGAIASCSPGLSDPNSPLMVFSAPIAVLHDLTDRRLSQTAGADEYVNLLQALLSFEGVEIWDRSLDGLQTGEYEVDCPYCGINMFVVIGQDDSFCCTDDYALRQVQKSPLQPARTQQLEGLPRRLFTRALADGQESLADGVRYLFGRAACPDCETDFSVAERVVACWIP
ncbi:hypothetical protein G3I60_30380 [Streptomyces sp. SID13666]|uniref:hypothetical protein n=1 Tax=unclassified Streptomyces TaxID=2593676 RepID=UPI0013C17157|nr:MULTISPECIES: hypothetical protein [unclassified Streptomyces]NEA58344.1 hypothetical protein [Streptomyces sp. SID13666]NEA69168.1 hypothetical protein [Streptomyces sp. SID13588]